MITRLTVYYNGTKVPVKSLKDYASLYYEKSKDVENTVVEEEKKEDTDDPELESKQSDSKKEKVKVETGTVGVPSTA